MRRRIAELVAIAAATVSSAATGQSKIAPPRPPYIGAYQPKGVDEIGLCRQEDDAERALANSPILIRDEALNSYVKNVLCAAVGTDRCGADRLYTLRIPICNSKMYINGQVRASSDLYMR